MRQVLHLSFNARLVLVYSPLLMMCASLCTSTILSAFILLITKGRKTEVGFATGLQGLVNLLIALPAGTLADRFGRQTLLRVASVSLLCAVSLSAVSLLYLRWRVSDDRLYDLILGMSVLWGAFMGLHSAPLEALFGDSVPSGHRSQVYVWRASLRTLGAALGPAVSAVIFALYGDQWHLAELTWVMMVGAGGAIVPALLLWGFSDANAIGEAAEGLHIQACRTNLVSATAGGPMPHEANQNSESGVRRWLNEKHIAPMIAISDLVSMLGSGMTIKFFALFFWQDLELHPVAVSLIYVAGPVGISAAGLLAQRLSLRIGRIQTALICRSLGVLLLVTLALVREPLAAVPLYLLRTWLMNCTQGLSKSVLNDYVAKSNRAKWNSLESINTCTWSGSAVLGGWLCDRIGYRHTFIITAALQGCSLVLSAPLAFLVALETRNGIDSGDKVAAKLGTDTPAPLRAPLLESTESCSNTEPPEDGASRPLEQAEQSMVDSRSDEA